MAQDDVRPIFDFEMMKLRKGQRPPKGWIELTLTAADFPPDWPANKPYPCGCGCGHTMRAGERIAVRNVQILGFGTFKWKVAKSKAARAGGK